ncbi:MAG: endopeptidase La [Deltaproteobacteria bacterium]|nr:endopeptidase La [Deltaproteobacteria bacterium]
MSDHTEDIKEELENDTLYNPLLPLRDIIVFPHMVAPLFVGRDKSVAALEEAMKSNRMIVLATQKQSGINNPYPKDIFQIGTLANIVQMLRLPDETVKILVEGKKRVEITEYTGKEDFFFVKYNELAELSDELKDDIEIAAIIREVKKSFETYVRYSKIIPPEILLAVKDINDPSHLSDAVVVHLSQIKLKERQNLLEMTDPVKRLESLYEVMKSEIEVMQVEKRIRTRVKKQMERTQKEYYLNEQMHAIQRELGEKDEFRVELLSLEKTIKSKPAISKEALEKSKKEMKKLQMMPAMSAEATVIRNYLDWISELPWGEKTSDAPALKDAEDILEADHYGLKKIKERIIEHLAVQMLSGKLTGPILCFVGPPGTGKTSLARSVARATGREFVRLSLGGVRDEAEIRGHRRTYIGAMPGKIIQSLKRAKVDNPVFLFDEIDKMSSDFRGDPASALLEVLDPEQNNVFNDHYLDLDYDLSDVMFITTANTLSQIPVPLRDRMEIIELSSYTEPEKLNIATRYLSKRQKEKCGLGEVETEITEDAIGEIITRYTKEAGVRNLEREISKIYRKIAAKVVRDDDRTSVKVDKEDVLSYLGIPKYKASVKEEKDHVGLVKGLAVTSVGGELLSVEVSVVPGKGRLIRTGRMGEVMQEASEAALTYVRSRWCELGISEDFYKSMDIHIHFPEGAVPKDGPSAGIATATCIVSALAEIPVRADLAMTGEITLRGRVLPIGGLKEKLMAAHKGGISTVIIPAENQKDLQDVPEEILNDLEVVLVEHVDQVLAVALVKKEVADNFEDSEIIVYKNGIKVTGYKNHTRSN